MTTKEIALRLRFAAFAIVALVAGAALFRVLDPGADTARPTIEEVRTDPGRWVGEEVELSGTLIEVRSSTRIGYILEQEGERVGLANVSFEELEPLLDQSIRARGRVQFTPTVGVLLDVDELSV